jgi:hypothetical protein
MMQTDSTFPAASIEPGSNECGDDNSLMEAALNPLESIMPALF